MNDPIEWGFNVPASEVDLDRIQKECMSLNVFSMSSYLLEFERKAPVTFARYKDKYLGGTLKWGR